MIERKDQIFSDQILQYKNKLTVKKFLCYPLTL